MVSHLSAMKRSMDSASSVLESPLSDVVQDMDPGSKFTVQVLRYCSYLQSARARDLEEQTAIFLPPTGSDIY